MASILLGRRGVASKKEVTQERAQGHRDHDPSIVRHKHKPAILVSLPELQKTANENMKYVHEHEGVKVLQAIQPSLDKMRPLSCSRLALSWREERCCLSNVPSSIFTVTSKRVEKP